MKARRRLKNGLLNVYLDTNVLKFAVHHRKVYRGHPQTIKWGHLEKTLIVYDLIETDEVSMLRSSKQKDESRTLQLYRMLHDTENFGCHEQRNSDRELATPEHGQRRRNFFGAKIVRAPPPIKFGRVIAGAIMDPMKDLQFKFLASIKDKRFLELQKMTGAYQGKNGVNRTSFWMRFICGVRNTIAAVTFLQWI